MVSNANEIDVLENCKWMCFVLGINMQKRKSVQVVRKKEYGANSNIDIWLRINSSYKFAGGYQFTSVKWTMDGQLEDGLIVTEERDETRCIAPVE